MTGFKVIGNDHITLSSVTGGFQSGRKITFQIDDGAIGVVKVPDSLSVDDIRATIQTEADRLDLLNNL